MFLLHRTWAEIDINALVHNFKIIKNSAPNSKIMAVVKANAYGHSVEDVAPALDRCGADYFAVSNLEEAIQLRQIGIKKPILILGYTPVNLAKYLAENEISQCVYSAEYAAALSENCVKENLNVKIHLKLDTGMSRLGFDCRSDVSEGITEAINAAKLPNLELEGVFTHFSVADRTKNSEDGFTDSQYNRFISAIEVIKNSGLNPEFCHCCNSAGMLLDKEKQLDLCRPGIILYGLTPSNSLELKETFIPVMTFKSVVSMVKEIKCGDTVSYGRTFTAPKSMKIATVAVGYADGYPRSLAEKAYVLVRGKRAKIVGRICMDQLMIDVSDIENVTMGDEVVLFGKELPVEELAEMCGTINYEMVCSVSSRVPRIIKEG